MFYLACTRFNDQTYYENTLYKHQKNIPVIYGTTLKIRESYAKDVPIFVVEMNNNTNTIEGIGLIKNRMDYDERHRIYSIHEYNRYVYVGYYWLSRQHIAENDETGKLLPILETILFKGKSHLKCRLGITIITNVLFDRWGFDFNETKNTVKNLFLSHFKTNINSIIQESHKTEDEDEIVIIPTIKIKKLRKSKNSVATINNLNI